MRFFAFIAAIVLFIITALAAFAVDSITIRDLIGLTAVGLGCLTLALITPPPSNLG
jgi:hypothetical protein